MKTKALLLLLVCLLVVFVPVYAQDANGSDFSVLINTNGSLGFQNTPYNYVRLTVTSGAINSTSNNLGIRESGGWFIFTALNNTVFRVVHNVTNVKVGGDSSNPLRLVTSGSLITVVANDAVTINWDMPGIEPFLPFMFILGMCGLVSLFGGSLYAVDQLKKHRYREGLINGVIFVSMGFALVLAWLWAA